MIQLSVRTLLHFFCLRSFHSSTQWEEWGKQKLENKTVDDSRTKVLVGILPTYLTTYLPNYLPTYTCHRAMSEETYTLYECKQELGKQADSMLESDHIFGGKSKERKKESRIGNGTPI